MVITMILTRVTADSSIVRGYSWNNLLTRQRHSKSLKFKVSTKMPDCYSRGYTVCQGVRFSKTFGAVARFQANQAPYCSLRVRCRTVQGVAFNPIASPPSPRPWPEQFRVAANHLIAAIGFVVLSIGIGHAQTLTARISISSLTEPIGIKVEGTYSKGSDRWPFRNSYGRVVGLAERIQNLTLTDAAGASIPIREAGPGEFRVAQAVSAFSYQVSVGRPLNPSDGAHISWLSHEHGYLMLADLLPDLQTNAVRVEFSLPRGWSVASSLPKSASGWYELPDKNNGLFFVGGELKEKRKRIGNTDLTLVTAGEWSFSREAATEKVAKIINDHHRHTGFELKGPVTIMLAPLIPAATSARWSAETRGSTVVLLAGRSGFSLGQLSVVLCHELFHLWVPNALSLEGDYDWFFEGFTLYQALCAAVRLKFIDFQEYLDTLARVYNSYLRVREADDASLFEASRRRWTSGSNLVYDKGMLVAFLYDLKLRRASHNRRGLDDVYRELLKSFKAGSRATDGNETIVRLLARLDGDEQFVRSYIQSPGLIELETLLPEFGMRVDNLGQKRLRVADALSRDQLEVLEGLGYRQRRK
jgi:predicted metalloprotease with PDZ domain